MNNTDYNFIGNKIAEARDNITNTKKLDKIFFDIEDYICVNTKNKDL